MSIKSKHKKIIIIVIATTLIICATAFGITYSWFVEGMLSDKFQFTVAYVDSKIVLYQGVDNNKDGVLDRVDGKEKYLNLGDSVSGGVMYDNNGQPMYDIFGKPVIDPSSRLRMDIKDFMPTQIMTYKIQIQNTGDVKGKIKAIFDIPLDTLGKGIDVLSATINNKTKVYFATGYTTNDVGDPQQLVTIIDGVELDFSAGSETNPDSIGVYELKIMFETLENLRAEGISMTQQEYNENMGKLHQAISLAVTIEDLGKQVETRRI